MKTDRPQPKLGTPDHAEYCEGLDRDYKTLRTTLDSAAWIPEELRDTMIATIRNQVLLAKRYGV